MTPLAPLAPLVAAARAGELAAFARLVEATQQMAMAVAFQVMRGDEAEARDAVQDAYLCAFRRLRELERPEAFAGWLRRIVITTAHNRRRSRRAQWVPLEHAGEPPLLDEEERDWSHEQQRRLARAILTLSAAERRLCELHYHGRMSAERLATQLGVDAAAVRKRMQRLRDKLRKEIEMDERRALGTRGAGTDLPGRIVELLARPRLVDLPGNPVAATLDAMRGAFAGHELVELPEEVDLAEAERRLGGDAVYIDRATLQRIDGDRVLRYDLTLPLLLSVRFAGTAIRLLAAGKAYRLDQETALHLEAFHQLEAFLVDDRGAVDRWQMAGRILDAVDRALPRAEVRMTSTDYPMCSRAFSLDVRQGGEWVELLAWGEYADWVLRAIGADPARHIALGAGFGLERIAALRYGIDDIRKVATARVA